MSDRKRKLATLGSALLLLALAVTLLVLLALRRGAGAQAAPEAESAAVIVLSDAGCSVKRGAGAVAAGDTVTIKDGGTYTVTGRLSAGQLIVDAGGEAVTLLLAGAEIHCPTGPALHGESALSLTLELQGGTENTLSCGSDFSAQDGNVSAAVYAVCGLTVAGEGALTVQGGYKHGVAGGERLTVASGRLTVEAVSDALHGETVELLGGELTLTAGKDGAEAKDSLRVQGGNCIIRSEGKGLKAGTALTVTDGSFTLDCGDDAVHSDGAMDIGGGSFRVSCTDDAFHAETTLTLRGGELNVSACTEGIEAPQIDIEGGTIDIISDNDGVNACTSAQGLASRLTVSGGRLTLLCGGDGLDSNGDLVIRGGELGVSAQDSDGNAALDYGGEHGGVMRIDGGSVVACGFARMAKGFDGSSAQPWLLHRFDSIQPGGTTAALSNAAGETLLSFTPGNAYNCVIFSSPALRRGESCAVEPGGERVTIQ